MALYLATAKPIRFTVVVEMAGSTAELASTITFEGSSGAEFMAIYTSEPLLVG